MMEHVQSQESRPAIPSGVKTVAWVMLVYILLGLLYFGILTFTAHRGEVMFRYVGRDFLVAGLLSRILGIVLVLVTFGAAILSTAFTLRGRMWAYGVLVAFNLVGSISVVRDLAHRHFDLMAWVPFVVLWVLIRDFSAFREYARSRRRKES